MQSRKLEDMCPAENFNPKDRKYVCSIDCKPCSYSKRIASCPVYIEIVRPRRNYSR